MWKFLLKKGVKIPLIVIGGILLLLVLINILVPPIAKSYVHKHSKDICGRQIEVQKVKFNIFNGKVALLDTKIWEANDKDMFISFDQLSVNASLYRLLSKEVRLTEITLVRPQVSIWQEGSTFNFTDIIKRFTKKDKPKKEKKKSFAVDLRNITLDHGSVVYRDLVRESKFDVKDLSLAVPQLYFSGQKSDIGVNLKFVDGGDLAVKMLYGLADNSYNLHVKLNDFSVAMAQPYLKDVFNIQDFNGKLTTDLTLVGSLEHILDFVATGNVKLKNLGVNMASQSHLLDVGQISVDVQKIDLANNQFHFGEVAIQGLDFLFQKSASSNTLSQLMPKKESKKKDEKKAEKKEDGEKKASKPMDLKVEKFVVADSKFTYADNTMKQAFSLPVSGINISAQNVSLNEPCDVRLKSIVGDGGELMGMWHGTFSDMANQKFNVMIHNVKMKDLSPFSVHYLAYPITGGLFSFTTQDVISNNFIKSDNKLDIYKCEVGNKMKDVKAEYNIPLKAAVYVITDRKGKIAIDLPVSGDIKSPNFSFKKIIFKTLMNFLVKVAASPIDLIINAIGASQDTFSDMPYALTDKDLSSENYAQLNSILDVMKEKPGMILTVQPSINKTEARELYAQQLSTSDTVAIDNAIDRSIQFHDMLIKNYFTTHGIKESQVDLLPLGEKKTPKGKSLFSFDVKVTDDMFAE